MKLSDQMVKEQTQTRLVDAITQDQFVLYGQPVVALTPGADGSSYVEVLIRYLEEEKNCLPPGGFLEVLESLRLMSVLDRWVVGRVIRVLAGHHAAHKNWNVPRYSINFSVDSLLDPGFSKLLVDGFRKNNVPRASCGSKSAKRTPMSMSRPCARWPPPSPRWAAALRSRPTGAGGCGRRCCTNSASIQ